MGTESSAGRRYFATLFSLPSFFLSKSVASIASTRRSFRVRW